MAKYICEKLGNGCNNNKTYYDPNIKCEDCGSSVTLTKANELER